MNIWFDMDGTLADFYADKEWKAKLEAHDPSPYKNAKPLLNMQALARVLNNLSRKGHKIGIISWLSSDTNAEYDELVTAVKREWLKKHLASVAFDVIDIVAYGTPKHEGRNGILFDDNAKIRNEWGENAYDVNNIIEILKTI